MVGCVSDIARRIAASLNGVAPLVHPHGCEMFGLDEEFLSLQMERLVTHLNIDRAVLVSMACGSMKKFILSEKVADSGRFVETINFHKIG